MQDYVADYAWEPVEVTTEDGYILTMFKISNRHLNYHDHPKSVLYQHGYGQDATTGIGALNTFFPGEKASAFKFVDEGFNVYMGNFRGTKYSLAHTNPDPSYNTSFDYWNFTFAEIGVYDVPAFVDKIYTENGGEKIYIVNSSMATTATTYALATPLEEEFFVDRVHKVI